MKLRNPWLLIAAAMLILGAVLCGVSLSQNGNHLQPDVRSNNVTITEPFDAIFIESRTDDVELRPSNDGTTQALFREVKGYRHEVAVENGTLTVRMLDERSWLEKLSFSFFSFGRRSPEITVVMPASVHPSLTVDTSTGDVNLSADLTFDRIHIDGSTADVLGSASALNAVEIAVSTGDILLDGITASEMTLSVSTGDISVSDATCRGPVSADMSTGYLTLRNVSCQSLSSDGSTGDILLDNVVAAGPLTLNRSTGDVVFQNCDAVSLDVSTSTGDITGTLRSPKQFTTSTGTGDISVPQSTSGGLCNLSTSTGDITILIP